jgi:hypothetical protein
VGNWEALLKSGHALKTLVPGSMSAIEIKAIKRRCAPAFESKVEYFAQLGILLAP